MLQRNFEDQALIVNQSYLAQMLSRGWWMPTQVTLWSLPGLGKHVLFDKKHLKRPAEIRQKTLKKTNLNGTQTYFHPNNGWNMFKLQTDKKEKHNSWAMALDLNCLYRSQFSGSGEVSWPRWILWCCDGEICHGQPSQVVAMSQCLVQKISKNQTKQIATILRKTKSFLHLVKVELMFNYASLSYLFVPGAFLVTHIPLSIKTVPLKNKAST